MAAQILPDETRLQECMGRVIGNATEAAACFGILLGNEPALYRCREDARPFTANALSELTECSRRRTCEGLDGRAASTELPGGAGAGNNGVAPPIDYAPIVARLNHAAR